MSKPLTNEEITRAKWYTALRSQGHRKCTMVMALRVIGFLPGDDEHMVCALGLLAEVALGSDIWGRHTGITELANTAIQSAGMPPEAFKIIVGMNDVDKLSFAQIADEAERLWPVAAMIREGR